MSLTSLRSTIPCARSVTGALAILACRRAFATPSGVHKEAIDLLNRVLEIELAGVAKYTNWSFGVFGPTRHPVVEWLRGQAKESLDHAIQAGDLLTQIGGTPSSAVAPTQPVPKATIDVILQASLVHEKHAVDLYRDLLKVVEGKDIVLEEYARGMVVEEASHVAEVKKMLLPTGSTPSAILDL